MMNRKLVYIIGLALMAIVACKRDDYWNQTTVVPRGSISGTLINTDDNTALKGVKILFERQTKANGERTFIDTVATDEKGQFSYEVPFPNKVKVAVRDTGRYQLDEAMVEVNEQKEYPVALKSFPRFGLSSIRVTVADHIDQSSLPDVQVSLWVKEAVNESYSLAEIKKTDAKGMVRFEQIAFPVRYKVRIAEDSLLYDIDSLEGRLLTKDMLDVQLQTKKRFGQGDILLKSFNYYLGKPISNEKVLIQYKSISDKTFSTPRAYTMDAQGQLVLENVVYPGVVKISALSGAVYPFTATEVDVTEEHVTTAKAFTIVDLVPRAAQSAPAANSADNSVESLVDGYGIFTMELDSKQNIWAVTTNNQLIKITPEGNVTLVAGIGGTVMPDDYDPVKEVGDGKGVRFNKLWGIGMADDYTIYLTENDGIHLIKKVVVDPQTGASTVSIFSGTAKKSGSTDGAVESALYNRPSDIAYSKKEDCLYVAEWTGTRIRKIDLKANKVSTLATGSGVGYAFGISLSADESSLYIAAHTSSSGIKRLDLASKTLTNVKTSGVSSPRHVCISPDGRIFYTENKDAAGSNLKVIIDVASGTAATVAGTGITETGLAAGAKVPANSAIFGIAADPAVAGLVYDPYRGRLYVASAANKKLYFVKVNALY